MKNVIIQSAGIIGALCMFLPSVSYAQVATSVTVSQDNASLRATIQALEAQVAALSKQIAALSGANMPPSILAVTGTTKLAINQSGAWVVQAFDPDGSRLSYNVNWGDNSIELSSDSGSGAVGSIQKARFIHTFDRAGTYPVVVTVIDEHEALANYSVHVTVENPAANNNPPLFTGWPTSPLRVKAGSVSELKWFASDVDKGDRDFLNISTALKNWTGSKLPFSTESLSCPKRRVGESLFCQKFEWQESGTVTLVATVEDPYGARFSEELKVVIEN